MRLLVLVQKRARVRERLHRLPEITFFSFFRVPPATKIVVTEVTSTDHTVATGNVKLFKHPLKQSNCAILSSLCSF